MQKVTCHYFAIVTSNCKMVTSATKKNNYFCHKFIQQNKNNGIIFFDLH